jgi:methionyl-tRNA synthetase
VRKKAFDRNGVYSGRRTTVIVTYGKDNAHSYLVTQAATSFMSRHLASVDHFLQNEFYLLDGKKFSTSRRHAIWVRDFMGSRFVRPDEVRLFLSLAALESKEANFDPKEFIDFVKTVYRRDILDGAIQAFLLVQNCKKLVFDQGLEKKFNASFANQRIYLSLNSFSPSKAAKILLRWTKLPGLSAKEDALYWWLKGLSVLAYPFCPRLSEDIWADLGLVGPITNHNFRRRSMVSRRPRIMRRIDRSIGDIEREFIKTLPASVEYRPRYQ